MSLQDAARPTLGEDGRFTAVVPSGWEQGRGAYGGLVVASLLRAMEDAAGHRWPIRAANAEIPSPVEHGSVDIEVRALRVGSGLSSYEAHLWQGGAVRARASAIFGSARPVDLSWAPAAPAMADWREIPAIDAKALPPPFARHFEYRPVRGLPFTGADDAAVEGFIRPLVPLERLGAPEIAAMVDAYWPAFFPVIGAPRPAATVAFGLHLTPVVEALNPREPLYYRARALQVAAGYLFEQRELWSAAGALVALNPQTFAVIK